MLGPGHPIFRAHFPLDEKAVIPDPLAAQGRWTGARQSLYGVFDDDRMVALLSQEHLRCAWSPNQGGWSPQKVALKTHLVTNIYAFAFAPPSPRHA
jgi:hypothetical protein